MRKHRWQLIFAAAFSGRKVVQSKQSAKYPVKQYQQMLTFLQSSLDSYLKGAASSSKFKTMIQARPRLNISQDYLDKNIAKQLKQGVWISVAPGAMYPTKQVPLDLLVEVLEETISKSIVDSTQNSIKPGLIIIGGDADVEVAKELESKLLWKGKLYS